ncbi:protein-tyrosine-phosphatase [Leucobacter exalbidus]|uniref:protein-tyrosine-phosphatase n=1 Tax=Leucobacter exalbidus TaxID=662960 RepID=A0A940PNC9_9MICO|nr:protein-tyrosine-phosphatase [Leucobacter exalbidus]
MTRHLLFVCHANIVRSRAAELLARDYDGVNGDWEFDSAGVHALTGHPVDTDMGQALAAYGIDTAGSRGARQIDGDHIDAADLILTFERAHRDFVVRNFPVAARRTLTLRRAAQLLENPPRRAEGVSLCVNDDRAYTEADDFADPVGLGPAAAVAAAAEIHQLLAVTLRGIGAIR